MRTRVVCCAVALVVATGYSVTLENQALRLEFAEAEDGYAVQGVVNRLVGDTRFVKATGQADFWMLDFLYRSAAGTNAHLMVDNHAPAASRTVETRGDRTFFVWRGIDLDGEKGVLDVTAEVRLAPGAGASEWRLAVTNRSTKQALFKTFYPCLGEVMGMGVGDALLPYSCLGAALRKNYTYWDDAHADYRRVSPSWTPPLAAFNLGAAGLYFGAHDPTQRLKTLVVAADHGIWFETIVENAGLVGEAAEGPRYPVTVAAYRGDWWQAAKIYRAWALGQEWARKGPIAKRTDFPKALIESDLLFRFNEPNAQTMSNNVVQLKRIFPDLNLTIHWYCWSQQPYCVNFPEFFPAAKGVKAVVQFAHDRGVKMVPYVDPRLWDVDLVSWAYAKHDACRSVEGELSIEEYYPKHKLAVMCPTGEAWREVAVKMTTDAVMSATESINGCGFDGVYHDQVACSRQVPCWGGAHNHAKGGGDWWYKGYRRVFGQIHDWCAKRGAMVLSEGTGDMCLDQIDGFLKASTPRADEVPFYPAVYGGRAIYYGNYQNLKDDAGAFYAYEMRDFTAGVLLGWLDRWNVTSGEFAAPQQCLALCARVRRAAAEFMIYGTLEDEVRFTEPVKTERFDMQSIWHKTVYHFDLPLVTGTVWKDVDGTKTAVVLANASAKPQTVSFRLPASGLAIRPVRGVPVAQFEDTGNIGRVTIPAHSAAFMSTE